MIRGCGYYNAVKGSVLFPSEVAIANFYCNIFYIPFHSVVFSAAFTQRSNNLHGIDLFNYLA